MKKNNLFALVLVVGICMAALAGCGADQTANENMVREEEGSKKNLQEKSESETFDTVETGNEDIVTEEAECEVSTGAEYEMIMDTKMEYPLLLAGYYDKDLGITIGPSGDIRKSTDQGATWVKSSNSSRCRFGMDIIDGTTVYTCGNEGQNTKSTDGGETFERIADFGNLEPNHCTMMSFCNVDTGIIASGKRIAITKDGGTTWEELTAPTEMIAIRMADENTFCVVGNDMTLHKTTDGGVTWTKTQMPLDAEDYYIDNNNFILAIDGIDAYTVFGIQWSSKTLRSFSTTDNWNTSIENTMPEFKVPAVSKLATMYLNNSGSILTLYNMGDATIKSFSVVE